MLSFLVHKIFTYYINGVLNCKYPAPEPNGLNPPPNASRIMAYGGLYSLVTSNDPNDRGSIPTRGAHLSDRQSRTPDLNIIIYLTANRLSPGGSGYNACT